MKRKVCTPVDMLHHVKVTGNVWDNCFLHIIHEVNILHTPAGWKFLLITNFIYTCSQTKTFSCLFLFCSRVWKHFLHHIWPILMLYRHYHFIIVQIHNVLISASYIHYFYWFSVQPPHLYIFLKKQSLTGMCSSLHNCIWCLKQETLK